MKETGEREGEGEVSGRKECTYETRTTIITKAITITRTTISGNNINQ